MLRYYFLLLIVFLTNFVCAADFSWDGGGSDNLWTTAENWAGDVASQWFKWNR